MEAVVRPTGSALRVTVHVGENDMCHHKPLFTGIAHRAHGAGPAGASVFRGIQGFGASSLIHTMRLLSLREDLPVAIVIVDTHDRIRAFLPRLDELVPEGFAILDDSEAIRCTGRDKEGQ
ncbi:DUF190 domain-containing protein [Streptomyces sp. NPDC059118]|uniref:DUF190 domain-containing protein n=1 Tax=unclassified Streptomyces TaxID=2593676 RepID=UPI0036AB61C8